MKHWRLRFDGFGDAIEVAETASKAKWQSFVRAQDAGWFLGRDGFRRFLSALSSVRRA